MYHIMKRGALRWRRLSFCGMSGRGYLPGWGVKKYVNFCQQVVRENLFGLADSERWAGIRFWDEDCWCV